MVGIRSFPFGRAYFQVMVLLDPADVPLHLAYQFLFTPSSFLGLETASGRCDCNNQSREPTKVSTESRRMKGDEALRKTLNCRKIPCGHETVQQTK